MKDITQKLHSLKFIEPDPQYAKRSRSLILSQKMAVKFSLPIWFWAGVLGMVLVSFSLYNLLYYQPQKIFSSLDGERIKEEFNNLTINIQLKEISYQQSINQTIAAALTEIGDTQTKHLNPAILESEQNSAELEKLTNPEIDDLLNRLVL